MTTQIFLILMSRAGKGACYLRRALREEILISKNPKTHYLEDEGSGCSGSHRLQQMAVSLPSPSLTVQGRTGGRADGRAREGRSPHGNTGACVGTLTRMAHMREGAEK